MSLDRGMDKEDMVHIHNAILLSHKKNEIGSSVEMWIDPETVTQTEVKSEREKQIL